MTDGGMTELDRLRRDVHHLLDRTAIADCIAVHARGCDRHDVELLTGTYVDDRVDDLARYGIDADAMGDTNASGRIGEPDEIGDGVLFFASDASSFCSGQTLYMHGGPGPAGV
jgi:NAD(P)-dependent dehydrogenase (short-subunit alcohol dehydrogenase family)